MRQVYEVTARRDGRWWMVEIPSIRGLTQAQRLEDVEEQATSYIAVNQDKPVSDIGIEIVDINVPSLGKAGEHLLEKVAQTKQRRAELTEKAQDLAAKAAATLGDHIMTLANRSLTLDERLNEGDIGFLFDLSKPRVNQIVRAETAKAEQEQAHPKQAAPTPPAAPSKRVSSPAPTARTKKAAPTATTNATAGRKPRAASSAPTKRAASPGRTTKQA